jgi:hypothetical protein
LAAGRVLPLDVLRGFESDLQIAGAISTAIFFRF